jgi:hypothetical protein
MDELENPYADEAAGGAADADPPQDPVQAAKDEAWLAQFRADNASAVVEYDAKETMESQAQMHAQEARRDYDLSQAAGLEKTAAQETTEAAVLEKKAQLDALRHDEYEARAEVDRHEAASGKALATGLRADAKIADAAAKRLGDEVEEEVKNLEKDQKEYKIMQEQAVAAQRIATDEAKLRHPGDPAPADPAAHPKS